jgi:hypothetical protein
MIKVPKDILDTGITLDDILFAHSKTKLKDREIKDIKLIRKTDEYVLIRLVLPNNRVANRYTTLELRKNRIRHRKLNLLLN